jgi:hypothetical protein
VRARDPAALAAELAHVLAQPQLRSDIARRHGGRLKRATARKRWLAAMKQSTWRPLPEPACRLRRRRLAAQRSA